MTGSATNSRRRGARRARRPITSASPRTATAPLSPPSLNPAVGDPSYDAFYQWAYDPLVVMQPDGTFGPGLAAETDEGEEIAVGTIREGFLKRYTPRKFALKLIVTDEAMEDNKYPETLRLAKRLDRAIYKTADIDATNILIRAANATYVGGDGVSLASAAHTLPAGGTFSNTLATPMAPSALALATVRSLVMKLPGHDGVTEGYDIKKVVGPTEQWAAWKTILGSEKSPEAGNFAAINAPRA